MIIIIDLILLLYFLENFEKTDRISISRSGCFISRLGCNINRFGCFIYWLWSDIYRGRYFHNNFLIIWWFIILLLVLTGDIALRTILTLHISSLDIFLWHIFGGFIITWLQMPWHIYTLLIGRPNQRTRFIRTGRILRRDVNRFGDWWRRNVGGRGVDGSGLGVGSCRRRRWGRRWLGFVGGLDLGHSVLAFGGGADLEGGAENTCDY